jgi:chemotaxis protein MotB
MHSRLTTGIALTALGLMAAGCVPQDRYDALLTANRSLEEQLVTMEDDRDEARASLTAVQQQLSQTSDAYGALQTKYDALGGELSNLEAENDDYLRRVATLEMGPLPVEIASAIENLVRAHPDMVQFDVRQGMVRFASDFTFDLGSVTLREEAYATVQGLADILNDDVAENLEVRVVGHTDNVKIGKPETRRQHPTNTHLSVHRAISVRDAFTAAGVDAVRIQVAGHGEFRPVVANGRRGAAENRRVEIYLAPMPDFDWGWTAAETEQNSATVLEATDEPIK